MKYRLARRWAPVLFATFMAACGSGGGGETTTGPDYLPLATGNRWVADDGSGSQITGRRTVDGVSWWVSSETAAGGAPDGEALLMSDSQGVRFYSPAAAPLPAYTLTQLRLPLVVGDRYPGYRLNYTSGDFDSNGTADDIDARTDMEVIGTERVVTPAGTFEDAAHVRMSIVFTIIYRPSGVREDYSTGTVDFWYAPGVGPVKFTSSVTTRGVTETRSNVLTGYRVGTRTGGTLPGG